MRRLSIKSRRKPRMRKKQQNESEVDTWPCDDAQKRTFRVNKMIVRAGEQCCGRSTACPGPVSRRGALLARPDRRAAISDGIGIAAPWPSSRVRLFEEGSSCFAGRGISNLQMIQTKRYLTWMGGEMAGYCGTVISLPLLGGVLQHGAS